MDRIEISREKYTDLDEQYAEMYGNGGGQDIDDSLELLKNLGIVDIIVN